jgi:outer membrane autotransporter protein
MTTHMDGGSVHVNGDTLKFEATDSIRSRLGARLTYAFGEQFSMFGGLYWEREFDGEQRMTANGTKISAPNMSGDTAVGEIGMTLRPMKQAPIFIDLGAQGYMGVRSGAGGNLQVRLDY